MSRSKWNPSEEELQAGNAAEKVVYSAISRWSGLEVSEHDDIPCVRDGQVVGYLHSTILGNVVNNIVRGRFAENSKEQDNRRAAFVKISQQAAGLANSISELNSDDAMEIILEARGKSDDVSTRVIRAIGVTDAVITACKEMEYGTAKAIKKIENQLGAIGVGPGAPRNEAAYEVTLRLARLYAKVTGDSPTSSVSVNGPAGEFTPVLERVFSALGWPSVDVREPTKKAASKLKEEDFAVPNK